MLLSYRIQFETIENNLINSVTQLQEKITKDILIAYFEMFKQIKNIQISSLDPVIRIFIDFLELIFFFLAVR